jgi:uncharacterized protein YutE (UPF0331/DUF86 family)
MSKWRLLITTLPIALLIVTIKLLLTQNPFYAVKGILDLSEIAFILTAGIFLIGFMLSGTLSDYKESEKIPGEIATTLETLEDTLEVVSTTKTQLDLNAMRKGLMTITNSIVDYLMKRIDSQALFEHLHQFNTISQELDKAGVAPPIISRVISEQHNLRKTMTRTMVISKTGFLAIGYALLEILLVVIACLLMAANFKTLIAEVVVTFSVMLVYAYMYRVIKDIDDPFEYQSETFTGAAEVPLFPLIEYRERLKTRLKL